MGRQIEAHHYCSHVTEEFYRCVIYDGNEAGARLIGVEYIVSERIFKSLPEEEKALWHSHRDETLSGALDNAGHTGAPRAHGYRHPRLHLRKDLAYVAGGQRFHSTYRHPPADDGLYRRRPTQA